MDEHHRAELRLDEAVTSYGFIDGRVTRHPQQHFLDFVLDGRSLRELADGGQDLVTPLCRTWSEGAVTESIEVLLGRPRHPGRGGQRVELLVCAVCGDVGCGAVTARLTRTPSAVIWSDFLWEGTNTDAAPVVGLLGRIEFERDQYESAFAGALDRVADLPDDRLAHRGRPFRWPWQQEWRRPRARGRGRRPMAC